MHRLDCHDRIKRVKGRLEAALQTVQALRDLGAQQPQYLYRYHLDLAVIRALDTELRDVYFVRMFACFESSLRHYWQAEVRDTSPPTEVLLSSIAVRCGVPQSILDAVQEIRDFRNHLIHEEHQITRRFTMDDAMRQLNTYLARLPLKW